MRRPGILLAGMLLATGAGLALASPASAATGYSGADTPRWYHCHSHYGHWDDDWFWDDGGDHWTARSSSHDSHRRYCHNHRHGGHGYGHGYGHGGHVSVGIGAGGIAVSVGGGHGGH
jgi:hypothetical protein